VKRIEQDASAFGNVPILERATVLALCDTGSTRFFYERRKYLWRAIPFTGKLARPNFVKSRSVCLTDNPKEIHREAKFNCL